MSKSKTKEMRQINLGVSDTVYQILARLAHEDYRNVAAYCRMILERHLEQEGLLKRPEPENANDD